MDERPFFTFRLDNPKETSVRELKRFTREAFNIDELLNAASDLKYLNAVKAYFIGQLSEPSDDFVKFFASQVYSGRLVKSVQEQFKDIVKRALNQSIHEKVQGRLVAALDSESASIQPHDVSKTEDGSIGELDDESGIVTTQEEIDGFQIVRAVLSEIIDVERVIMRDKLSYCGILLDDNNRKPICRMWFNAATVKYIGLFDQMSEDGKKKEDKVLIEKPSDIFQLADRLKATVLQYDQQSS